MCNTWHVRSSDTLAQEAIAEVRELIARGVEYVAVRGETLDSGDDLLYGVFEAPEDFQSHGYTWEYVDAQVWLEKASQPTKDRDVKNVSLPEPC